MEVNAVGRSRFAHADNTQITQTYCSQHSCKWYEINSKHRLLFQLTFRDSADIIDFFFSLYRKYVGNVIAKYAIPAGVLG